MAVIDPCRDSGAWYRSPIVERAGDSLRRDHLGVVRLVADQVVVMNLGLPVDAQATCRPPEAVLVITLL